MTDKMDIQPKFFHLAIDYGNFTLFDKLLEQVDASMWKNQKKLEILYRFHYPNSVYIKDFTLDRYKQVIDTFDIDVNGSCYGYTPMTHIISYYNSYYDRNNRHSNTILNYLLSRPDIKINKPDREKGFPLLQCYLMSTDNIDKNFVEKLVNKGADINWSNKKKQNILHKLCDFSWYCSRRSIDLVKYLLFNSVIDAEQKDKEGRTPLDLANASIVKEEEAYQKAMADTHRWYTPNRNQIEEATAIRDLVQSRVQGGI